MTRYGDYKFIENLDIEEALSLLELALQKREEELLFQRWVHDMQFQMSFDEFRERLKPKPIKKEEEILADVKEILDLGGWTP